MSHGYLILIKTFGEKKDEKTQYQSRASLYRCGGA